MLTGCFGAVNLTGKLPYGVWESSDPYILMDISIEKIGFFNGKYEKDGEIIDVYIGFTYGKGFAIHESIENENDSPRTESIIIYGTYTYTKNKLKYTLIKKYQETTGYKTITFTKIEDNDHTPN